jgi:hypothetical protein
MRAQYNLKTWSDTIILASQIHTHFYNFLLFFQEALTIYESLYWAKISFIIKRRNVFVRLMLSVDVIMAETIKRIADSCWTFYTSSIYKLTINLPFVRKSILLKLSRSSRDGEAVVWRKKSTIFKTFIETSLFLLLWTLNVVKNGGSSPYYGSVILSDIWSFYFFLFVTISNYIYVFFLFLLIHNSLLFIYSS